MWLIRLYIRVLGQLGSDLRIGGLLALANVALAISAFAEPILFGRIIDVLTRAQIPGTPAVTFTALMPLIIAWVAFAFFSIGAGVLVALYADRLSHRRRLAVVANYFEHVLELPLAFHTSTHSGRVLKVMLEGSNGMAWLWLGFFREHFAALIALFILLPMTVFLNWRLGLLLVALMFVFAILTTIVVRKTESLQGSVERYHSSLAEHASDALGNVPVIQSFTRVEAEAGSLRAIIQQLLQAQNPVLSWWAIASVASRAAATITVTAVFLVGTGLHLNGLATIGEIVMFMSIATMLISRLEQAVSFINQLFMQAPKMREFFEILDTAPAVHDRPNAKDVDRFRGKVAFENVSFSYDGKRPAIQDVSFTVQPGENVALVGATGSGKSTTLGLLHRAFDPQSGSIRIDNDDIRDLTLSSLRRNIGVVFQEPMLFARSIRENLQVGRPEATDAEMIEALERAQAIEFISRQTDGLSSIIGERGRSLSGGERQRLSIARALLKNPPILILDEATSALDAATEQKLQLALDEVMKGRTTFVIAHRLATIRNADRILVFDHGRVIESGNFDELVESGGRFAELAKAQFMAGADKPAKARGRTKLPVEGA
ncbi:glucan ABC transporter ATP-binding protein/ permease [Microvirga brassicacearum]|uniref:Glucan ABC transporter ATP-binding protein/ permease n=1 Tax=Microvirga brassicacearum TaxID=2580413 RepID=A0A5N3P6Y2_9HYPH|nr:glucan ABC transporter ATP-binding protein/ permease [Microvirga brassicacearum]KAB0265431.1 glucan ABC transporter ATP-binding protein/ permease [Microvirga brassicacearum]